MCRHVVDNLSTRETLIASNTECPSFWTVGVLYRCYVGERSRFWLSAPISIMNLLLFVIRIVVALSTYIGEIGIMFGIIYISIIAFWH